MLIRFFMSMIGEADVQELSDEGWLSPDMNLNGDRVWTAEAVRKGECWSRLKMPVIYGEIWIGTQNFLIRIGA